MFDVKITYRCPIGEWNSSYWSLIQTYPRVAQCSKHSFQCSKGIERLSCTYRIYDWVPFDLYLLWVVEDRISILQNLFLSGQDTSEHFDRVVFSLQLKAPYVLFLCTIRYNQWVWEFILKQKKMKLDASIRRAGNVSYLLIVLPTSLISKY